MFFWGLRQNSSNREETADPVTSKTVTRECTSNSHKQIYGTFLSINSSTEAHVYLIKKKNLS